MHFVANFIGFSAL